MTITKTALAAAILAVMAVSAQAQQGPTRQIQVLPAPGAQAQAPAVAIDQAPANVEGQAPKAEAPAIEAAPVVTAPIVGASRLEHLDDAVAALELVLTDEEVRELEAPYVPHAVAGFI